MRIKWSLPLAGWRVTVKNLDHLARRREDREPGRCVRFSRISSGFLGKGMDMAKASAYVRNTNRSQHCNPLWKIFTLWRDGGRWEAGNDSPRHGNFTETLQAFIFLRLSGC